MKGVDLYARVRRAVYVEGMSRRGAARYFGIDPRTVAKMMRFSVPPGYRRTRPPRGSSISITPAGAMLSSRDSASPAASGKPCPGATSTVANAGSSPGAAAGRPGWARNRLRHVNSWLVFKP